MPNASASWITRRTTGPPSAMRHQLRWWDPIMIWVISCSRAKLTMARAGSSSSILPAFFVPPGARHVGVGQLVDQGDLGPSAQDRVEVHLLQAASPVFDHLAGDDLEAVDQLLGARPPVALDEPGDDVGAAPPPALALAEHGVGLADSWGRAQVDAERAGLFNLAGDAYLLGNLGRPSSARIAPCQGRPARCSSGFQSTSRRFPFWQCLCSGCRGRFAGDRWRVWFLADSVWIGTLPGGPTRTGTWFRFPPGRWRPPRWPGAVSAARRQPCPNGSSDDQRRPA